MGFALIITGCENGGHLRQSAKSSVALRSETDFSSSCIFLPEPLPRQRHCRQEDIAPQNHHRKS